MDIESGDRATIEYTERMTDETTFDTSRERVAEESDLTDARPEREFEPITVEPGTGQLFQGFEEEPMGLEEGDTDTITVPLERGYGEERDDRIVGHDRAEFEELLGDQVREEGMIRTDRPAGRGGRSRPRGGRPHRLQPRAGR